MDCSPPGSSVHGGGDREIGVLPNVEAPRRPRLECRRETGLNPRCDRKVGNPFQTKQGSRPSRPDQEGRNVVCFSGGASWDGLWRRARGTWSLWGPAGRLDFTPKAPPPSPPPLWGSRQSQTKKGIKEKGRSSRTEDPGVSPPPLPLSGPRGK